jgi:hypothetical protein
MQTIKENQMLRENTIVTKNGHLITKADAVGSKCEVRADCDYLVEDEKHYGNVEVVVFTGELAQAALFQQQLWALFEMIEFYPFEHYKVVYPVQLNDKDFLEEIKIHFGDDWHAVASKFVMALHRKGISDVFNSNKSYRFVLDNPAINIFYADGSVPSY